VERIFTNQDFRKKTIIASERMIPLPIHVKNNIFNTTKLEKRLILMIITLRLLNGRKINEISLSKLGIIII
jgi:hypothetical protein